jgi:REP element-mobilizing transposase RayT
MEIERIEPEFYYHVYNRGINKQPIFSDQAHYRQFLFLCEKYLPKTVEVLAYCLIPNHFHLLLYFHAYPDRVGGPRQGGSNPFSNLLNAYAQFFNKQTDRVGGLFQRPFKRKRITDDEYLRQVIYYIHRNPIHHGLTDSFMKYPYSSYSRLIGGDPGIVSSNHVFQWFDDTDHFTEYHQRRLELDSESMLED